MYFAKTPSSFPRAYASQQSSSQSLEQKVEKIIKDLNGRKLLIFISREKTNCIPNIFPLCNALKKEGVTVQIWVNDECPREPNLPGLLFYLKKMPKMLDKKVTVFYGKPVGEEAEKIISEWKKEGADCRQRGDLWA